MPQAFDPLTHQIDHIVAVKHGVKTVSNNLCLACFGCNNGKGSDLSGIDPVSGKIVPLYNPRRQKWRRHFRWRGARLIGLTQSGRATIAVLGTNLRHRVLFRQSLIEEGVFPPS